MSFSIQLDSSPIDSFKSFNPTQNDKALENLEKLKSLKIQGEFQGPDNENKIFAKNWSPLLCYVKDEFQLRPMRYGIVHKEDPSYVNTKNLTIDIDKVDSAKWSRSLKSFRAIISMRSYYIMETKNGLIDLKEYSKKGSYNILAPVIYDNWFSEDKSTIIQSFALISSQSESGSTMPFDLNFNQAKSWLLGEDNWKDFKLADLQKSPLNIDS